MATKAVHLELITGYASDDFIAAFRRFTSTRGPCTGLFSDQGTTFIGADKALKELYVASTSYMQKLQAKLELVVQSTRGSAFWGSLGCCCEIG